APAPSPIRCGSHVTGPPFEEIVARFQGVDCRFSFRLPPLQDRVRGEDMRRLMLSQLRSLAGAALLMVAASGPVFTQEQGGSIQGVVKDSSGAVLPGVTIEARSP